jgi:hypothetical protein
MRIAFRLEWIVPRLVEGGVKERMASGARFVLAELPLEHLARSAICHATSAPFGLVDDSGFVFREPWNE